MKSRVPFLLCALALAACATAQTSTMQSAGNGNGSGAPPSPDPRVGLRAGWMDAAEATWNLRVLSETRPSASFIDPADPGSRRFINSDLAFTRNYAIQGNYSGWQVWDISNPRTPTLYTSFVCPGSQSDVSVYKNLLFVSGESTSGRLDCGTEGVTDTVSHERLRGLRIFDVSDFKHPRYIANVQTCRGSHTHTVVTDPKDPANIYIYISGAAPVRSPSELAGCSDKLPEDDPNSALFRIEVVRVPLAAPEQARIVSSPRIFSGLGPVARHAEVLADSLARKARIDAGLDTARPEAVELQRRGPVQCHDITVYPAIGRAGGACRGYGLLLDITDAANPVRIGAVSDSNFSFWHSATFNNDGSKILFTDEWGGGTQPRCRVTDKPEWGADAIFRLTRDTMDFVSYYKLPAPQTPFENCVAHNGNLIPVPGRDIMVQAWYQGGISVFDWTDPAHPTEIAYFDRGPMDSTKFINGAGAWSSYWYNGVIVSSEMARGLDIFELVPSAHLSQNEIDAAKLVRWEYMNAQDQQKIEWPASFVVARAFVDQLERGHGLSADRVAQTRSALASAEQASGDARRTQLAQLASTLEGDAASSSDAARVRMLVAAVRRLQ